MAFCEGCNAWQLSGELAIVFNFPGQGRKRKSMGLEGHMENYQHFPQLSQLAIGAALIEASRKLSFQDTVMPTP